MSLRKIWLQSRLSCRVLPSLRFITNTWRPIEPWCENITISTKPEVHNVSPRRQRRTEPRRHATRTKNWWNSAVWFSSYASGQTDRQTYTHVSSSNKRSGSGRLIEIIPRAEAPDSVTTFSLQTVTDGKRIWRGCSTRMLKLVGRDRLPLVRVRVMVRAWQEVGDAIHDVCCSECCSCKQQQQPDGSSERWRCWVSDVAKSDDWRLVTERLESDLPPSHFTLPHLARQTLAAAAAAGGVDWRRQTGRHRGFVTYSHPLYALMLLPSISVYSPVTGTIQIGQLLMLVWLLAGHNAVGNVTSHIDRVSRRMNATGLYTGSQKHPTLLACSNVDKVT